MPLSNNTMLCSYEGHYPYLEDYSGVPRIEWRNSSDEMIRSVYNWFNDHNEGNVFYMGFCRGALLEHILLEDLIDDPYVFELIKDPNTNYSIMMVNNHEAFNDDLDGIYKHVVIKYNIPSEKIHYVSAAVDNANASKIYADKYGCSAPIKTSTFFYGIRDIVTEYNLIQLPTTDSGFSRFLNFNMENGWKDPNTLTSYDYEKVFLNLNRRWRPHRPILVALLKARNLFEHGFISLAKNSDDNKTWQDGWHSIEYVGGKQFPELLTELLPLKQELLDLPNLYLDTEDLAKTNNTVINPDLNYYFENSLISLVSETNFFTFDYKFERHDLFLSEKSFKPISMKHPFIIISVPHTLKVLRWLGFKTFGSIIDESYDSILNDYDRLDAILNEVEKIVNHSTEQRIKFVKEAREITEYNYKHLHKKFKGSNWQDSELCYFKNISLQEILDA